MDLSIETRPPARHNTILKIIESKTKYEWQTKIKECEEFNMNEKGLIAIQARTGTGKTHNQADRVLHYKKLKKKSVTLYVPNNSKKFLVKQTNDKFKTIFNEREIIFETGIHLTKRGPIYTIIFECGFECIIKPFIANNKSPKSLLKKHDSMNPLIIDEFDGIQTQFGLIHGGCPSKYSKSTIKTHENIYDKTEFNFFEKLCNQTSLDIYSATLDELICKDLRPYENKINMTFLIVTHKKDSLENVNIVYKNEDDLKSIIVQAYENNEKTLVFVPNISDMEDIEYYLECEDVDFYSWNSKKEYQFCKDEIDEKVISIFVNGPTRGLDIQDIKNIVLFRGLKASTKEDINLLSALANQIMGRIRKDGMIYRDISKVKYRVDNLFDLVEKIYENVLDDKYEYLRQFWREITNKHIYDIDYIDNIVRLFINNWLMKDSYHDSTKGDSIPKRFKRKFIDNPKYERKVNFLKEGLNKRRLDEPFISRYIEFEKVLIEEYKIQYCDISEDLEDEIEIFSKRELPDTSNTTGGGNSKPNISDLEREKGERCLREAIINCGLEGLSLIVNPNISDDEYSHEYMHAKPKSELSNEEATKSKYAIPMADSLEKGINQEDKVTILFNYDDEIGITFNYDILMKSYPKKIKKNNFRTKDEIDKILCEYNKLQQTYQ